MFRSWNRAGLYEERWKCICTDTGIYGGEGKITFVPSSQTEEAGLEETLQVDTSKGSWKILFSGEGRKNEFSRLAKNGSLRQMLKQMISDVRSSRNQEATDTFLALPATLVCSVGAMQLFLLSSLVRKRLLLLGGDCYVLCVMYRTFKWGGGVHARVRAC